MWYTQSRRHMVLVFRVCICILKRWLTRIKQEIGVKFRGIDEICEIGICPVTPWTIPDDYGARSALGVDTGLFWLVTSIRLKSGPPL